MDEEQKTQKETTGEIEKQNKYKICFVDGHTLRYTEWEMVAVDKFAAQDEFNRSFGDEFDHCFKAIYENDTLIWEEK